MTHREALIEGPVLSLLRLPSFALLSPGLKALQILAVATANVSLTNRR